MFDDLLEAPVEDLVIKKIIFDQHCIPDAYTNCFGCELFLSYPSDDTFTLTTDQLRELLFERGEEFAAKFLAKAKEFIDAYYRTIRVPTLSAEVIRKKMTENNSAISEVKKEIAALEAENCNLVKTLEEMGVDNNG